MQLLHCLTDLSEADSTALLCCFNEDPDSAILVLHTKTRIKCFTSLRCFIGGPDATASLIYPRLFIELIYFTALSKILIQMLERCPFPFLIVWSVFRRTFQILYLFTLDLRFPLLK